MTPKAPGGALSEILIASVGTMSGPAASSTAPIAQGAQVWVRYINSKGGLGGRQVKLIVYDDGGDPARHRAQVQEAVERHKVIAFLQNAEQLTGPGSIEYITAKGIPIVGTGGGMTWAYSSPMYFPQATEGEPGYFTFIASTAQLAIAAGKKKLGTLACAEAQGCADLERVAAKHAPGLGFEHVYRARASIAQPDFTAECLAARNAGTEVFFVALDSNSITRLTSSCARQGFKPTYATLSSIVQDRFKDDPNLDGLLAASNVFPWFQTNLPAAMEYREAMKTFGNKLSDGVATANGWTAGKLFELAGANLPEPPTSQALLENLWSIKGNNLGGLTMPLTFIKGQSAPQTACWFNMVVRNGKWVSPDDYKLQCKDWKP